MAVITGGENQQIVSEIDKGETEKKMSESATIVSSWPQKEILLQ